MQMDVKPNSGNLDKCVCTHCWLGQMFTWIKSASPRSTFHTLLLQHGIFFMATYENHETYWQDDNIILLVGLACEQRSPEHCFLFIIQSIINQVATWLNQVCLCCTAGSWSGSPWAQIRRVWVISSSQPIVLVGCSHKQTHLHARLPQPPWRSSFPTAHKTHHNNPSGPLLCPSFRWPEGNCLVSFRLRVDRVIAFVKDGHLYKLHNLLLYAHAHICFCDMIASKAL